MAASDQRLAALLLVLVSAGIAAPAGALDGESRDLRAIRADTPPRLDGVFDDPVWRVAPAFGGFTQRDPDEGEPASERTSIQFAYDDEALYVAVTAHDGEAEKIAARMVRRDGWVESDRVSLFIDAHNDHQTGVWFEVNAA